MKQNDHPVEDVRATLMMIREGGGIGKIEGAMLATKPKCWDILRTLAILIHKNLLKRHHGSFPQKHHSYLQLFMI
jgi:hypothetical protein